MLYGCGLRLMECVELRVKDLHLDRGEVIVRQGKGFGSAIRSNGRRRDR